MGDMYMADPIRPGDMNSSSILGGKSNSTQNNNNNADAAKIIKIFIFLVFLIPFVLFIFAFIKAWNEIDDEMIGQIDGERFGMPSLDYELSNDQQMAAARIFSTGLLYEKDGPKTIAQSDCRHLKNAVTAYFNKIAEPAQWYDDTYCDASTINLATYFLDEKEQNLGGIYARIDIGPKDDTRGCMNVAFVQNFRYIAVAKKLGHCNASKVKIEADDINVPEVSPNQKSENDDLEENSNETYRNVQHS